MADLTRPAGEASYMQGRIPTSSVGHSDFGSEERRQARYPQTIVTQEGEISAYPEGRKTDPFSPNDHVGFITPPRVLPSVDGHLHTSPYGVNNPREGPLGRTMTMEYPEAVSEKPEVLLLL